MINFKQYKLLAESFNSRPLGMKTSQNLGLVSSRPGYEEAEMQWNMKHMHKDEPSEEMDDDEDGSDDEMGDDEEMPKKKMSFGDEDSDEEMNDDDGDDDDDLGIEKDTDIDDMGDDDGDDMGDDGEEGDDDFEEKKPKKKPMMSGMPHDASAFMAKEAVEARKNLKKKNAKAHPADCDCVKCLEFKKKKNRKSMNEDYLPPQDNTSHGRYASKSHMKDITSQYSAPVEKKYFSGIYDEDILLPPEEPTSGEIGYGISTRVGAAQQLQQVTEAVSALTNRLRKLEQAIKRMS